MNILSENAAKVLVVMADLAMDTAGGAFGCQDEVMEDVVASGLDITPRQLSGYIGALNKKGFVISYEKEAGMAQQYQLAKAGWLLAGYKIHPSIGENEGVSEGEMCPLGKVAWWETEEEEQKVAEEVGGNIIDALDEEEKRQMEDTDFDFNSDRAVTLPQIDEDGPCGCGECDECRADEDGDDEPPTGGAPVEDEIQPLANAVCGDCGEGILLAKDAHRWDMESDHEPTGSKPIVNMLLCSNCYDRRQFNLNCPRCGGFCTEVGSRVDIEEGIRFTCGDCDASLEITCGKHGNIHIEHIGDPEEDVEDAPEAHGMSCSDCGSKDRAIKMLQARIKDLAELCDALVGETK